MQLKISIFRRVINLKISVINVDDSMLSSKNRICHLVLAKIGKSSIVRYYFWKKSY